MFLDFYGLREQPFGMTPDPAYLYASRTHANALTSLSYGIKDNRGFLALIAEPGMGKTTLLYQLLDEMRANARTVFVFQTQCNSREFFQYILQDLNVDATGMGLVAMHTRLNEILFEEMLSGRRFVLVVDEAQNLDETTLETVRMLSNFETQHTKLLQIVLAGQPQLASKLAQPRLSQLRQRIAVLAHLDPFTEEETGFYIDHRLRIAGFHGDKLFDDAAIRVIAQQSQGIPRNINNICYTALMLAASQGYALANAETVREAVNRLDMTPLVSEPVSISELEPKGPAQNNDPIEPVPEIAISPASDAAPSQMAPDNNDSAAKPVVGAFVPRLTYDEGPRVNLAKWSLRAAAVISIIALGISVPSILRYEHSRQERAPKTANLPATQSIPNAPSNSTAKPAGYDAAPQDTAEGQVLTVTATPQQSLRELTLRYVGHYDDELSKQILQLNPGLQDPDHLEPGQLIRIPLPPGSIKKMNDTAESPAVAPGPKPPESLFNRFTALLRDRK